MAHGIHGNGGGGKSSSGGGKSSGGSSSSSRSSGGGRRYVSPIPKLNYSTTDKSSARGRGNESYLRQDIADQKANGGSINDRNFLAETVEAKAPEQQSRFSEEANNGERRSNNEYQQQKEKTRFLDEAVNGREAAEKKAQERAVQERQPDEAYEIDQYGKGNIDLHNRDTGLYDEDGNLMTVRSMSFNEDGKEILVPTIVNQDGKWVQLTDEEAIEWYHRTGQYLGKFDSVDEANRYAEKLHEQQEDYYIGAPLRKSKQDARQRAADATAEADRLAEEKAVNASVWDVKTNDEADKRIAELREQAKTELASANTTDARRDAALDEYRRAVDEERTITENATFMNQAEADTATANRKQKEEALKAINRKLGNDEYYGLSEEARPREFFENTAGSWITKRGAGDVAGIGTGLWWLGDKINNTSLTLEDANTGEEREIWNAQGKGDALARAGQTLFEGGKESLDRANQDWAEELSDMSPGARSAMELGSGFADIMTDHAENQMLPGLGTMAMFLRTGGHAAAAQADKERNDIDSMALSGVKSAAAFGIGMKLLGGFSKVYGESMVGKALNGMTAERIAQMTPAGQRVAKALMNTQGFAMGLTNVLDYAGDKILGLDPEARLSWDETKSDMAAGYALGVLTNLVLGGAPIKPETQKAIGEEAVEFALSGKTMEEAAEIARETVGKDVTIRPGKAEPAKTEPVKPAEAKPAERTEARPGEPAPQERAEIKPGAEDLSDLRVKPEAEKLTEPAERAKAPEETGRPVPEEMRNPVPEGEAEKTKLAPELNRKVREGNATPEEAEARDLIDKLGRGEAGPDDIQRLIDLDRIIHGNGNGQNPVPNGNPAGNQNSPNGTPNPAGNPVPNGSGNPNANPNGSGNQGGNGPSPNGSGPTPAGNPAPNGGNGAPPAGNGGKGGNGNIVNNLMGNEAGNAKIPKPKGPDPNRRTKISEYFENTLKKSGRDQGVDPKTMEYNVRTEAESLAKAVEAIGKDFQGTIDNLVSHDVWTAEMVDQAWIIENELLKWGHRVGTPEAKLKAQDNLNTWKEIEKAHISEVGAALQAVAKQSRPGAAGVLDALGQTLEQYRNQAAAGKAHASESEIRDLRLRVGKVVDRLLDIEVKIDNYRKQAQAGNVNAKQAEGAIKTDLIKLVNEINARRNTGLFLDKVRGKNQKILDQVAAGQAAEVRTMLGEALRQNDIDYIHRYASLCATGMAEDINYKVRNVKTAAQKVRTLHTMGMLLGLGTTKRNIWGNSTFSLVDMLSNNGVGTLTDSIVSKATGTGKRSVGFRYGALDPAVRKAALKNFRNSMLEVAGNIAMTDTSGKNTGGVANTNKWGLGTQRSFDPNGSTFSKIISDSEQTLSYALRSTDALFRGGEEADVRRSLERANRGRAGAEEIQDVASQMADYELFQNRGIAAKGTQAAQDLLNVAGRGGEGALHKGGFGLGNAVIPFTTVPANLGVKLVEHSPLNMAKGIAEIDRVVRTAKKTGQVNLAEQNKAVMDFARGTTGTAIIAGLTWAMLKDRNVFKNWDNENDKDVKEQNKAEGKSGMQFNLSLWSRLLNGEEDEGWQNGDNTIDISSNEPLNQFIRAASMLAEELEENPDASAGDIAATGAYAVGKSSVDSIMQTPAVQGLANIEDSIRYSPYKADADAPTSEKATAAGMTFANTLAGIAGNTVSSFIPAASRHLAAATDEWQRDTQGDNAVSRAWNQVLNSIPGARQTLPIKTDNFGNPISNGDAETRRKNAYNAYKYSTINQSDVSREVERIREETGVSLMPSKNPVKKVQYPTGTLNFSYRDGRDYQALVGKEQELRLKDLFATDLYKNATPALQAQMGQEIEKYAKDTGKTALAEAFDIPFDSDYAGTRELDKPVEYLATTTGFSAAKKAEKWDVVDALMPYIKKMSGKDRDYLRDKNSQLMSYYDYMTPNAHGYKVDSTEDVVNLKEMEKANAAARGVKSASGADTLKAIEDGYRRKKFSDDDVYALMTKQASDGDYDLSKGRVAIFLAAIASGKSIDEAFRIIHSADADSDGTIDEKGLYIKAEREGTKALKKAGVNKAGRDAFDEIMYPNGRGKRNGW